MLDRARGAQTVEVWLGRRNKATNMELNKCLLNGCCVPGMYTGHSALPWWGSGSSEKGVGRPPEHTQWSDATSCLQFKTRELKPTHPPSAFSFLTPGSLGCPCGGHLSQVANYLSFRGQPEDPITLVTVPEWEGQGPTKQQGTQGPHNPRRWMMTFGMSLHTWRRCTAVHTSRGEGSEQDIHQKEGWWGKALEPKTQKWLGAQSVGK